MIFLSPTHRCMHFRKRKIRSHTNLQSDNYSIKEKIAVKIYRTSDLSFSKMHTSVSRWQVYHSDHFSINWLNFRLNSISIDYLFTKKWYSQWLHCKFVWKWIWNISEYQANFMFLELFSKHKNLRLYKSPERYAPSFSAYRSGNL